MTPCGDINLGQLWLKWWLSAWWRQANTRTSADLSLVKFRGIHLGAILQWVPKLLSCITSLKMIISQLLPHFPVANEFNTDLGRIIDIVISPSVMSWQIK